MSLKNLEEAKRMMIICNACRYCEGYCAVFPAMELRRTFKQEDLIYLANLCHNSRDCYYACQYAPPHEFGVNIPAALGRLRLDSYQLFSWPARCKKAFQHNVFTLSLLTGIALGICLLLLLFSNGISALWHSHTGPGAFYAVLPYWGMVLPALGIAGFVLIALVKGFATAWRVMGREYQQLKNMKAHWQALWDVMRLKYLDGGGYGCNYPDDRFRMIRRNFHHLVFYGFVACFVSTAIAAVYDHIFHWPAPYPVLSLPVVFGTLGGVSLVVGTAGLMSLKIRMDKRPAPYSMVGMDIAFIILLFLVSFTGILLLAVRETSIMGPLLVLHIGLVLVFLSPCPIVNLSMESIVMPPWLPMP